MHRHLPFAAAALAAALHLGAPPARAAGRSEFASAMPRQQRAVHVLDRLAFGPRAGEVEQVRKTGVKKWIERQLDPRSIPENPALEERLRPLDTLALSPAQLVRDYPPPQVVRRMVQGAVPYPEDPLRRAMVEAMAARFTRRSGQPDAPDPAAEIARLLTPRQASVLRRGAPRQKLEVIEGLPARTRDEVLAAIPPGMRMQIYPLAEPALRAHGDAGGAPAGGGGGPGRRQALPRHLQQPAARGSAGRFLVQPLQRLPGQGRGPLPGDDV